MNDRSMLDRHLSDVFTQIAEASKKHDLGRIGDLYGKAKRLEDLRNQYDIIQSRIASLDTGGGETPSLRPDEHRPTKLRELAIEVTAGMKRQNLLTLTPHVKRGRIKPGEQLSIEALPSGARFQTELVEQGNKLRARGEIAQFYKDAAVSDGDYVILTEIAAGRWTLKKASPGTYGPPTFA